MADLPPPRGARRDDEHEAHDPELIATLLDRELSDAELLIVRKQLEACPACAALHADLVALATANLTLTTPARPRDFTLTPNIAATLVPRVVGELVPAAGRLAGSMRDSRTTHATHDRLLVASLVDRSVSDSERVRGEEELAACHDCTRLFEDLVALSNATRALPVPARPHSYTLTSADAERLRVRGWRRLLAAIGSPGDLFSRPLAVGLTTLGLAGLLVATIPSVLTGQAATAETRDSVGDEAREAAGAAGANSDTTLNQASAAPSGQTESGPAAAAMPAPAASAAADQAPVPSVEIGGEVPDGPDRLFAGGDPSSPAAEPGDGFVDLTAKSLSADEPMVNLTMFIVAGLLLLAGMCLFGLRWAARRLGDG